MLLYIKIIKQNMTENCVPSNQIESNFCTTHKTTVETNKERRGKIVLVTATRPKHLSSGKSVRSTAP